MERSAAIAHLVIAPIALVVGLALFATHPEIKVLVPIGEPIPFEYVQHDGLRRLGAHLAIIGALLLVSGGALFLATRNRGRAPLPAAAFVALAPAAFASTLGAAISTPPDPVSMLILLGPTLIVVVPLVFAVFVVARAKLRYPG